jgi:hypothetical protein
MSDDFEQGSPSGSLRPLAVSVRTAAKLLGVGTTTIWGVVGSGAELEVLRVGRRTLVKMASLEALVASHSDTSMRTPDK